MSRSGGVLDVIFAFEVRCLDNVPKSKGTGALSSSSKCLVVFIMLARAVETNREVKSEL